MRVLRARIDIWLSFFLFLVSGTHNYTKCKNMWLNISHNESNYFTEKKLFTRVPLTSDDSHFLVFLPIICSYWIFKLNHADSFIFCEILWLTLLLFLRYVARSFQITGFGFKQTRHSQRTKEKLLCWYVWPNMANFR